MPFRIRISSTRNGELQVFNNVTDVIVTEGTRRVDFTLPYEKKGYVYLAPEDRLVVVTE